MTIQIKQKSSCVRVRQWDDLRWEWSVWLDGPGEELDQIDYVTYTLHPTFVNPVRVVRTRRGGFRLKSSGWGEFTIYIDIARKDGGHRQLSHDLKLTEEPPKKAVQGAKNVARDLDSVTQRDKPSIMGSKAIRRRDKDMVSGNQRRSKVFISGGAADSEATHSLSKILEQMNVRVISAENIPAGVPIDIYTEGLINQANLAVFLLSGRPSMWMNQEIESAKRHGKQIVPVLVGADSGLPEALQDLKSLRLPEMANVYALAQGIASLSGSLSTTGQTEFHAESNQTTPLKEGSNHVMNGRNETEL